MTTQRKLPPAQPKSEGRHNGRVLKLAKKKADRVMEARVRDSISEAMPFYAYGK